MDVTGPVFQGRAASVQQYLASSISADAQGHSPYPHLAKDDLLREELRKNMIPHGPRTNININLGSLRSSDPSERQFNGEQKYETERADQVTDDSLQRHVCTGQEVQRQSVQTLAEPDAEEDLERDIHIASTMEGDPASTLTENGVHEMLETTEQLMTAELSIKKVNKIDNESKLNRFLKQAMKQTQKDPKPRQTLGDERGSCYFLNSKEAVLCGHNPLNPAISQDYFTRGNIQREFPFKDGIAEPLNQHARGQQSLATLSSKQWKRVARTPAGERSPGLKTKAKGQAQVVGRRVHPSTQVRPFSAQSD